MSCVLWLIILVVKLLGVAKTCEHNNVDTGSLHAVIDAEGLADLLGDEEATSADYQNVKALVNGEINTFMGFNVHVIGSRSEGGLAKDGSTQSSFFFDQAAVGLAVGMDMKTTIDYVPERTSHLCTGMFKAGAVVRDGEGVVKVQYTV